MARVRSLFEIQGTLGGITFYKTKDGYLAKSKSSLSKKRLMNDPAYARTRENMNLFKRASHAGQLFRRAFRPLLDRAADTAITARLLGSMRGVINSDTEHPRGQGTVQDGNPELLNGFEFNENAHLASTLLAPFTASIAGKRGVMLVDIGEFDPGKKMKAVAGATHFRFFAGGAAIDFNSDTYNNAESETEYLPVDVEETRPIQLVMQIKPRSAGVFFVLLGIEFAQIINGVPIPMKGCNALAVVKSR